MGSFYNIDFNAKAKQNLPVRLRQAIMYAWLKVLISPVVSLAGSFKTNRDDNLYDLAHNGQVCKLEAVLNDVFDNTGRGIYISDPSYKDALNIYRRVELKPVYLSRRSEIGSTSYPSPRYLYRRSELYTGGGLQFIINVPTAVTATAVYDVDRLKALVDKYRLVSKKNYSIVIV